MENINLEKIEKQVEVLVEKYLDKKKIFETMPGYISIFLSVKKRFLKELYNIDWQSPEDLNSDVIVD